MGLHHSAGRRPGATALASCSALHRRTKDRAIPSPDSEGCARPRSASPGDRPGVAGSNDTHGVKKPSTRHPRAISWWFSDKRKPVVHSLAGGKGPGFHYTLRKQVLFFSVNWRLAGGLHSHGWKRKRSCNEKRGQQCFRKVGCTGGWGIYGAVPCSCDGTRRRWRWRTCQWWWRACRRWWWRACRRRWWRACRSEWRRTSRRRRAF